MHADTELEDVLARMQERGIHLARIYDSEGTPLGVVFLEDVIEQVRDLDMDDIRARRADMLATA